MSDQFVDTMWASASKAASAGGSFLSPQDLAALDSLSPSQLDALPFGAVRLDDKGVVGFYNRTQSEIAGVAPAQALGKVFFVDVAPCTNNKVFRGCFTKGVEQKNADLLFNYTFTYKMRPTEVKVHLHRAPSGANWVLIKKK